MTKIEDWNQLSVISTLCCLFLQFQNLLIERLEVNYYYLFRYKHIPFPGFATSPQRKNQIYDLHIFYSECGLLALSAGHHSREPDHGQDDGRLAGLFPKFEFSKNLRTHQVRLGLVRLGNGFLDTNNFSKRLFDIPYSRRQVRHKQLQYEMMRWIINFRGANSLKSFYMPFKNWDFNLDTNLIDSINVIDIYVFDLFDDLTILVTRRLKVLLRIWLF